jgi:hypothetical protein
LDQGARIEGDLEQVEDEAPDGGLKVIRGYQSHCPVEQGQVGKQSRMAISQSTEKS